MLTNTADGTLIQGNIRKPFVRNYGSYLILRFGPAARRQRGLLASLLRRHITSASQQNAVTDHWKKTQVSAPVGMFGLSYSGYEKLGLVSFGPNESNNGFETFRAGMRHPRYGGVRHLDSWQAPYVDRVDAFLLLQDDSPCNLGELMTRVAEELAPVASVRHREDAFRLTIRGEPETREHFGFRDGLSVEVPPDSVLSADNGATKTGLTGFGTFAAFMKLEQNVSEFNSKVSDIARLSGLPPDAAAAKIIGRTRDGQPLVPSNGMDGFDFSTDPDGQQCPLQAHIRVMNPRGTRGGATILRRSLSYGSPSTDAGPARDSGLLFLGLLKNLAHWDSVMEMAAYSRDPILSDSSNWGESTDCPNNVKAQLWKMNGRAFCYPFADVTRLRGGEYFYIPSMAFIEGLGSFPEQATDSTESPATDS